ncbi:MAG: alkaline shock response membrane anchor protein AmaP, partial [Microbispora sp.]|nr:alkaline shock response membrane anchor protein AmaP [Microbispora sp.]
AVPAAAVAMIACGVGLVALAVVPGRPRLMPVLCDDPLLAMGLTRSGLRRTLAAAAREIEHVRRADVHILRRRIEVIVVADADTTGALLREVGAAVGDRLAGLGVQSRHEVVVRLRRRGA